MKRVGRAHSPSKNNEQALILATLNESAQGLDTKTITEIINGKLGGVMNIGEIAISTQVAALRTLKLVSSSEKISIPGRPNKASVHSITSEGRAVHVLNCRLSEVIRFGDQSMDLPEAANLGGFESLVVQA